MLTLLNEQVILLATLIGAIAALPSILEFWVEWRKRRERLALSLANEPVASLEPRVAGMDALLRDIADLIDRARDPAAYAGLDTGNEILIIGPPLSGKRSFAQRVAKEALFDRLITIANPRNRDALAKAKSLATGYRRQKVMILIPHLDEVFEQRDEDLLAELDALIETTTVRENVQIVATAVRFEPDSDLDYLFGIKLVLPGTPRSETPERRIPDDARAVLADVARFYLDDAERDGFRLSGIARDEAVARLVEAASNSAEIEDILMLARTTSIHARKTGLTRELVLGRDHLEKAIGRVVVNVVYREK